MIKVSVYNFHILNTFYELLQFSFLKDMVISLINDSLLLIIYDYIVSFRRPLFIIKDLLIFKFILQIPGHENVLLSEYFFVLLDRPDVYEDLPQGSQHSQNFFYRVNS